MSTSGATLGWHPLVICEWLAFDQALVSQVAVSCSVGGSRDGCVRIRLRPERVAHLLQALGCVVDPLHAGCVAVTMYGYEIVDRLPQARGRMIGTPPQSHVSVEEHHTVCDDTDTGDAGVVDVSNECEPSREHAITRGLLL